MSALDESTRPAYSTLVESCDEFQSGCWCMGFHPEGVGKGTTASENRERKYTRDRMIGTHRWVVTRFVEPTS